MKILCDEKSSLLSAQKLVDEAGIAYGIAIRQLNNSANNLTKIQCEIAWKYLDKKENPETTIDGIVIGSWECPDSPVELCVYDDDNDMCHDCCLFCGDPDERK